MNKSDEKLQKPDAASMEEYVLTNLDRALREEWIVLYGQPMKRLLTGRLTGIETFARWKDPERGTLLLPPDFVPVLKKHRLIHRLDTYMIHALFRNCRDMISAGRIPAAFTINLDSLDFELCDMYSEIERFANDFEVPRERIGIELPADEKELSNPAIRLAAQKLRDAGCRVILDGCGTEGSSLLLLRDFPADMLKIDLKKLYDGTDRSRMVIAAMISLAKQLGIQTAAKRVETQEEAELLIQYGCEIGQGYYFGRPESMPFPWRENEDCETAEERRYYDEIGKVNLLSTAPSDTIDQKRFSPEDREMPLSILEYDCREEEIQILFLNKAFEREEKNSSFSESGLSESLLLGKAVNNERLLRLIRRCAESGEEHMESFVDGHVVDFYMKRISKNGDRCAFLLTVFSLALKGETVKGQELEKIQQYILSLFNTIMVFQMKEDRISFLLSGNGEKQQGERETIEKQLDRFERENVFDEDRTRYNEFFDLSNLQERIGKSEHNMISTLVRTRDVKGVYSWKCFRASKLSEGQIIVLESDINQEILKTTVGAENGEYGEKISRTLLWRNLINNSDLGIFWKDKDRRFLGANRKFLDYYGFDSEEEILGKNDEDMGWHVNPDPFKNDEYRVLHEGINTHDVIGTCISHGSIRYIKASKIPVYQGSEIVGLVGYFRDVTSEEGRLVDVDTSTQETDQVTGLLNMRGFLNSFMEYKDGYQLRGRNFAAAVLSLDNFKDLLRLYGESFMEEVIYVIGQKLSYHLNVTCVISRTSGDEFIVLKTVEVKNEALWLADEIRSYISEIHSVNGFACTLYPLVGSACYSEAPEGLEVLDLARGRMNRSRDSEDGQ